ncbi:MAG: hypothetical protein N2517_04865 [Ignavibacteria bacterium]|nr:hypothetical protein [Ignavibacteria bacterium]
MTKSSNRKRTAKSRNILFFLWGAFFLVFCSALFALFRTFWGDNIDFETKEPNQSFEKNIDSVNVSKLSNVEDKDNKLIRSDEQFFKVEANSRLYSSYSGKRLNIAFVGLDSRLGSSYNHADANHIISILWDIGKIEIISVPRDTPADAGFHDSTGQNKLTVVRASRGRTAYLEELRKITELEKIHYYVELGFSQVVGLLEFLGFKDSKSTLQVLRARKGIFADDFQRTYNQAQFIRQMILKHYNDINGGFLSELAIRGGLELVSTNLTYDIVNSIIKRLNMFSFPRGPNDVVISLQPQMNMKFKVLDFSSSKSLDSIIDKLEQYNKRNNETESIVIDVYSKLNNVLVSAEKDTSKFPKRAILKLQTYFDQKAWLQIEELDRREEIRTRFEKCLVASFLKINEPSKALKVKETLRLEREFLNLKKTKL